MTDKIAKQESQELVKQDQALARPSWIPEGDTTGTQMSAEDIRLPRLAIAQGLSPQLMEGDSSYIPDLKMFDMFNDVLGTVYGKGPLTFVPVRRDVRRIEFKPRAEGGGIIDMDVPPGDPRLKWDGDAPPTATSFDEFVVYLLHADGSREPIVISIKNTNKWNRRAAKNLNTFIALPHPQLGVLPIYGKKYTVTVSTEKNDKGTFGVYVIKQAGVLTDGDTGCLVMAFAKSLEGKQIIVEHEPGEDDFVPADLEAEAITTEM
jgi:hypothetical protein